MLIEYSEKYLPACVKIYLAAFKSAPFNYGWLTEAAGVRYFTDIQRGPRFLGYVWLAEETQNIAAVCLGCVDDYFRGALYEIKEIFVEPASQGRGLGTEFLAAVEKDLTNRGISCITLLTRREIQAYDFYLKNGFAENAGAALMAKTLK